MPTYEYRCPSGHDFELVQKMNASPRAKCPVCGKPATRQISGGAGLIFKGTGFYITDYGKDGKGPRQDKETEAKPEAAPAKTETAAAKPEKAEKSEKSENSDKGNSDKGNSDKGQKSDKPALKKPKS
jgi:putative FmdB family regulatory protein